MRIGILLMSILLLIIPVSVYADNYSYSPFRTGQSPGGILPSDDQIREDMQTLSETSDKLRVYSDSNLQPILKYANLYDLKLSVETNDVAKVLSLDAAYPGTIESIIIDSSSLTPEQQIAKIRETKALTDIPVTALNNPKVWLENPELVLAVDFVFVDVFTDEVSPANSAKEIQRINEILIKKYPYKHMAFETDWSTVGSSKALQTEFITEINRLDLDMFYFEYTDEDWKNSNAKICNLCNTIVSFNKTVTFYQMSANNVYQSA
ncbi:MAG: hypothetical protein KC444_09755 [Nitrosopumilus sp.]|nr:hypothetical protein [Nitrosopumilus sp.]